MCTIILIHGQVRNMPILVAANRDEDPDRPSSDPADIGDGVFAPVDDLHGGSWIGVNECGLLVAVTKRHSVAWDMEGRRSRGLLVTEMLRNAETASDAICRLITEVKQDYNPFHLVIADRNQAAVAWSDGKNFSACWGKSGVQVITDQGFCQRLSAREEQILKHLNKYPEPYGLDCLKSALAIHGQQPENGTCIHGHDVLHETVSSSIIALLDDPQVAPQWNFLWRNGRPCSGGQWHFGQYDLKAV